MVQIENEYGFWGRQDRDYIVWLGDLWTSLNISGPFYSADPIYSVNYDTRFEGMAIGLNGPHPGDNDWA